MIKALPCGRAATTWMAGSMALSLSRFRLFSTLASVAWASYMIGIGWLGGSVFAGKPWLGATLDVAVGAALAGLHVLVEKRRAATRSRFRKPGPAGHTGVTVKTSTARLAL